MSVGPWQIILIIILVILLFGAGKIPRLAADLAKSIKAFKRGMSEEEGAEKKPPQVTQGTQENVHTIIEATSEDKTSK